MTDRREMEAALEAVLFVGSEPVSRARLLEMFEEDERAEAKEALEAVAERYRGGEERGVMVEEVAGGLRLVTRPDLDGWLRRFFEVRGGNRLSMAALETLAIVAYRQPITAPEIQELRSVNPAGVLKTLLERHLIRIAGRKEVVGKPFLYHTTREFLVRFGLKSLGDLPPLEEFEEMFGEGEGPGGTAEEAGGRGEDREERIARQLEEIEDDEERREAFEEEEPALEEASQAVGETEESEEPEPAELEAL